MADDPDLDSAERRFGDSFLNESRRRDEERRLQDAVREAKPSILKSGDPVFVPRVQTRTEDEPRRTDFPRGSITHQQRQSPFPPSTSTTTSQISVGSAHPFKVTRGENSGAGAKALVQPGTVLGVVPKIGTVLIDNSPPPMLLFTVDGMALLRVHIFGFSDTFRPAIISLLAVKQNGSVIKDDADVELGELKMKWSDPMTKNDGYFFIKIATILCAPVSGIPTISAINQMLLKNIYSFIIVVDDIILLA